MIISSQRYINDEILCQKIDELESEKPSEIVLQTWFVGIEDLEILFNGHHTLEAARQCGIPVRFEVTEHPDRLYGEDLLEQAWIDSQWYDVETGIDL